MKQIIQKTIITVSGLVAFIAASDSYCKIQSTLDTRSNLSIFIDQTILFVIVVFLLSVFAALLIPNFQQEIRGVFKNTTCKKYGVVILAVFTGFLAYELLQDLLFIQAEIEAIHYQNYRILIRMYYPQLLWLLVLSLALFSLIFLEQSKSVQRWVYQLRGESWIIVGGVIFSIVLLISITKPGQIFTERRYPGFTRMNAPLLGIQVALFVAAILGVISLFKWLEKQKIRTKIIQKDWVLMLGLFVAALLIWSSDALGPSSFIDQQRAPNYEYYPKSDAMYYQQKAQEYIAGKGLSSENHPAYKVHLAILYAIWGDGYSDILVPKLALLSFIPALLYLITRDIHSRFSGVIVGSLFIIRERNAILLKEHLTLTTVVDMMTEPLAIFALIFFISLLVRWDVSTGKKWPLLLAAGGMFGWLVLNRIETVVMIPATALVLLGKNRDNLKQGLKQILIMGFGILVVAGPWLLYSSISSRSAADLLQGEAHHIHGVVEDFQTEPDNEQTNDRKDRSGLLPFNILNNVLQQFYYLPSSHQPFLTAGSLPDLLGIGEISEDLEGDSFSEKYLERYIRSLPYWWKETWTGFIPTHAALPLFGSILVLSLGVSRIPSQRRWMIYLLMLLDIAHITVFALVSQSGGRFIQLVDWIPLVFYGIGLSGVITYIQGFIKQSKLDKWWMEIPFLPERKPNGKLLKSAQISVPVLLILLGLAFPVSVNLIPENYSKSDMDILADRYRLNLSHDIDVEEESEIQEMQLLYGKVLTPRFFESGSRLVDDRKGSLPDWSYNRIEFYVIGSENIWAALPSEVGEEIIPNGSLVLLQGARQSEKQDEWGIKQSGDYIQVERVLLLDEKTKDLLRKIDCTGLVCLK